MSAAYTATLSQTESRFLDHLASRNRLNGITFDRLRRLLGERSDQLAAVMKLRLLSEDDPVPALVELSGLPPPSREQLRAE